MDLKIWQKYHTLTFDYQYFRIVFFVFWNGTIWNKFLLLYKVKENHTGILVFNQNRLLEDICLEFWRGHTHQKILYFAGNYSYGNWILKNLVSVYLNVSFRCKKSFHTKSTAFNHYEFDYFSRNFSIFAKGLYLLKFGSCRGAVPLLLYISYRYIE